MAAITEQDNTSETASLSGSRKDLILRIACIPIQVYLRLFSRDLAAKAAIPKEQPDPSVPAKNFLTVTRNMHAICAENGIRYYAVLQPMNGIGKRKLTANDTLFLSVGKKQPVTQNMSRFDFFVRYYTAIRRTMAGSSWFMDCSDRFDTVDGQVFSDSVHFSDKGQKIIAESLYELIQNGDDR